MIQNLQYFGLPLSCSIFIYTFNTNYSHPFTTW